MCLNIFKLGLILSIIFSNIQCQNINTGKAVNETDTLTIKKQKMILIPDKIYIESPIMVRLEIEKNSNKLIAKLVFANVSDEGVIVDENKLGGDNLRNHIFHLNPWYTSPNLTFTPYDSQKISPKYIVIEPHQVVETQTELNQYYDFDERKYDTLTIVYLNRMNLLDKNYNPILKTDRDGKEKPLSFAIRSNSFKLDYNKDIKPFLK